MTSDLPAENMMKKALAIAAIAAFLSAPAGGASAASNIALAPVAGSSYSSSSSVSSSYGSFSTSYSPYERYTGLVVDCRGLGLEKAMSPVVRSEDGYAVYGARNLNYRLVTSLGAADYSRDVGDSRRAGSNPLVVRAVALTHNRAYPVVSTVDASHIEAADSRSGFLRTMNVVFVY